MHPLPSLSVSLGDAGTLVVTFHRTVRVPRAAGKVNALPASLGTFPLYRVADFAGNVPSDWKPEGHFLPMYPHEAMWLSFYRAAQPVALLVGAGMVNAVTGARLEPSLLAGNYLCVPPQPWLDGFKPSVGEQVYQFVAAELGKGETAEEQILGSAEFGGLQLGFFRSLVPLISESTPHEYLESGFSGFKSLDSEKMGGSFGLRSFRGASAQSFSNSSALQSFAAGAGVAARSMGLGAGGSIRQKIYPDPYLNGRPVSEVWQPTPASKAYVYIVHANDFRAITGTAAPPSPITYATYQQQGSPWFGLPDGSWGDTAGGEAIDHLAPVSGGPDPTTGVTVDPVTNDLW